MYRPFRHLWVVQTQLVLLCLSVRSAGQVPEVQKQLPQATEFRAGLSPGVSDTQCDAPDCISVCCFKVQDLKRKLWKKLTYSLHVAFSHVFKSHPPNPWPQGGCNHL